VTVDILIIVILDNILKYKYGTYTDNQIAYTKDWMRKQIYFLLLCADPKTKENYTNIDINQDFDSLLKKFGGFNELLLCPPELVQIMSLLEAALREVNNPNFDFSIYRKLVLDAGSEVLKIKEVD